MSIEPKSTARRDKTDEWDFRKPATEPKLGTIQQCAWCGHAVHARGKKCGVPRPEKNNKPCKCKAGGGWLDGLGNAIGESLFGGDQ